MRLATWNCQRGLDAGWAAVEELDVDVLTVQECQPGTRETVEAREGWTCCYQDGKYGKGVAVMARQPYSIEARDESQPFVVSTQVAGPGIRFRFVGFWAMTPKAVGHTYTQQAALLIDGLPSDRLPTVVAGDFNASRSREHLANVSRLNALGLVSAYHAHRGVPHDAIEEEATSYFLWNQARRYHMDFVFVPDLWSVRSVEVGTFEKYLGRRLSDHVPVVVTLDPK